MRWSQIDKFSLHKLLDLVGGGGGGGGGLQSSNGCKMNFCVYQSPVIHECNEMW